MNIFWIISVYLFTWLAALLIFSIFYWKTDEVRNMLEERYHDDVHTKGGSNNEISKVIHIMGKVE